MPLHNNSKVQLNVGIKWHSTMHNCNVHLFPENPHVQNIRQKNAEPDVLLFSSPFCWCHCKQNFVVKCWERNFYFVMLYMLMEGRRFPGQKELLTLQFCLSKSFLLIRLFWRIRAHMTILSTVQLDKHIVIIGRCITSYF